MCKTETEIEPGKSTAPDLQMAPEECGCATSFLTQKRE